MGELLPALYEITIRIFEALEADRLDELIRLVRERQDLITRIPRPENDDRESALGDENANGFNRLIESGEALMRICEAKLEELSRIRCQQAVARTTARGYRPGRSAFISTRRTKA